MNLLLSIYSFVIGSVFASFFGVIIGRVPQEISIVHPASRCDNCHHQLKWYENIPVFSYLFLKGKCSHCGCKIGAFSLVYELIGGFSLVLIYQKYGISIETIFMILITLMYLLIAGFDYKTHLILDLFLIITFVLCFTLYGYRVFVLKQLWWENIISIVMAVVGFLVIKLVGELILKKEALGSGDIWLVGVVGIIYKPFEFVVAIFIGSFLGCIIELTRIALKKKTKDVEIAFCPYLCFGFYVMLLCGSFINNLLLG